MRRILAFLIGSAIAPPALAQGIPAPPPPPPPSTITAEPVPREMVIVSGSGSIAMAPDSVSFDVGVETRALKKCGVGSDELRTSAFNLEAIEKERRKVGYRITNSIGVTRKSATDARDLIALAIEAGANEVHGPEFSVQNEKIAQGRLEAAFADARDKAEHLATLSRRKLGSVIAATDGSSSPFEFKYRSPGV